MTNDPRADELFRLVNQLCDGDLAEDQFARLEQLIQSDPTARQRYRDLIALHAHLSWAFHEHSGASPIPSPEEQMTEDRQAHEQPGKPAVPKPIKSPVLGFLGGVVDLAQQSPWRTLLLVGIIFCGSIAAAWWSMPVWRAGPAPHSHPVAVAPGAKQGDETKPFLGLADDSKNKSPTDKSIAAQEAPNENQLPVIDTASDAAKALEQATDNAVGNAIASLTKTKDCCWAIHAAPARSFGNRPVDLTRGQKLELASGIAEITYRSGARVTVEGPASFSLESPKKIELYRGRLVALAPPRAVGFTVKTPRLSIVDRGTEFGVAVSGEQAADLVVFRGEVEVACRSGVPGEAPLRLKAGQSKQFSGERTSDPVASLAAEGVFIREISQVVAADRVTAPLLVSQGKPVTASSYWGQTPVPGFAPEEKFPPSRIVDGRLDDTDYDNTHSWWLAENDSPADITIDLEAVYTVSEIRLQNTHSHRNDRGARDVKLSLSRDGIRFTPLTRLTLPDVAGQTVIEFQIVPLVVPTEARYVKVEIPTYYGKGAGLSEVQVFATAGQPSRKP